MDDVHPNGMPPQTGGKDPCNVSGQQAEVRPRRRVAAVSTPALSASRLTLPGVMDAEGRVDESRLRMHIFKNGGVSPSERGLAWRFLFGMYPCSSTALERSLLQEQLLMRYRVMKRKWQQFLPSAVRIHLNAELFAAVRYFDQRKEQTLQQAQDQSEEVKDRLAFLELQSQILFERVTFDLEELREAIRIIDKDVPRTNRDLSYYQ
ncbi:hypothetical protein ILYODFUR_028640 [Ilyodon furcidens]|uniref:Rab-GAP TBC domain-containing protein n=1 Tax=Ilyodon furcidens TaxID=33524 RepID=A0ABV0UA07_9TELE